MQRRIVILLAALLLAVLSGLAVLSYAHSADRRAVSGMRGVRVLVARERIPAQTSGADIRAKNLTEHLLVPAGTVPKGTLTGWDSALDGMWLAVALEPGQLLMRRLFQSADATAGHRRAITVPVKQIAVTVALSVAPQVAGTVTVGDQVAVYSTCPLAPRAGEDQRTRLLLPRVKVIMIGEAPAPGAVAGGSPSPSGDAVVDPPAGGPAERYVVTLAVSDADAPRLVHATQTCLLYLGLLGPSATVTPGPPVDLTGLFP